MTNAPKPEDLSVSVIEQAARNLEQALQIRQLKKDNAEMLTLLRIMEAGYILGGLEDQHFEALSLLVTRMESRQ